MPGKLKVISYVIAFFAVLYILMQLAADCG
jgi:hypothetical protein